MSTTAIDTSSRDRLVASIHHRQPDRIPIDFGGTSVTGIHASVIAELRRHYGLEARPVRIHEPYQMLGWLDDDLLDAMGIDVIGVFPRTTMWGFPADDWKHWSFNGLDVLVPGNFNITIDEKGDTLIYPEGDTSVPASGRMPSGGFFFDSIVRQPPIDEDKLDPTDNTEEFPPIDDVELAHLAAEAQRSAATGRGIIATFGGTAFGDVAYVPGPSLKHPKGIRDITEWYVSTTARQDYIHEVFSRQCEIALSNLERIHAVVGSNVDAVFLCGTDFGTQTGAFCSTRTFKNLYHPYYKKVTDWIHQHTTWKTFKHSCGAVYKFVPEFIEAGIDILNPVQCSAAGMDPELLKSTYGDRITFWGGGVDTQKILPFGTPEQVREQVLRRCEIFAPHGGFVFNTIHNVQAKTPVENIVAMLDAVHEFNGDR